MRSKTPRTRGTPPRPLLTWPASLLGAAFLLASGSARAHIALTDPPARYHQDFQKSPPCGHPDNPPGDAPPTVLAGGETIIVAIDEFIDHPGHFRIAIAPTDAEFVDPSDYDDFYSAPNVILDDIEDVPGVRFHDVELEVPDIDCDPCVMQVLQIMYSNAPFSQGALYYQCADVVIEASGAATGSDDETGGDDDDPSGGDDPGDDDTGDTGAVAAESTGAAGDGDDGVRPGATEGDETAPGSEENGNGCGCTATHDRPMGIVGLGLLLVAGLRRRLR